MRASRVLVEGTAVGPLLKLEEPVSFWGGVDPATGVIVDQAHPQCGESLAGRIVVMPHGRGSSGASSVLAELLRSGNAPAGIVLESSDPILVTGSLVGSFLYGTDCPIVVAGAIEDEDGMWRIDGEVLERSATYH